MASLVSVKTSMWQLRPPTSDPVFHQAERHFHKHVMSTCALGAGHLPNLCPSPPTYRFDVMLGRVGYNSILGMRELRIFQRNKRRVSIGRTFQLVEVQYPIDSIIALATFRENVDIRPKHLVFNTEVPNVSDSLL